MSRQLYDVSIDGVSLRSVSSLVRVTGVVENPPQFDTELETHPSGVGQFMITHQRRTLTVQVTFVLTERTDLVARASAIDAVNAWAQAGVLTVSYRADKQLQVDAVTERPTVSVKDYTTEYSLTFSSYSFPFWVSATPVTTEADVTANTETSFSLTVPGNRTAYLEMELTPDTGIAVESMSIETSAGSVMTFSGIYWGSDTYHITYDDHHILVVNSENYPDGSELAYLTAASTDNLVLEPGANTVSITIDGKSHVKFSVRGVFT